MSDKINILALFSVAIGSELTFAESEIFFFRAILRISKKHVLDVFWKGSKERKIISQLGAIFHK